MTRQFEQIPTADLASIVFGQKPPRLDDAAEALHEASRLYSSVAPDRLATLVALSANPGLQHTAMRSSRSHAHRPAIELPDARLPRRQYRELLATRRSSLSARRRPLRLNDLAAVLASSYRSTRLESGAVRRPVPSGGALYPLDLYVVALEVEGLDVCAAHYDPFRHRLEILRALAVSDVRASVVDPELVDRAASVVIIAGSFWRSRFKYGTRGYRFVLLEAGHVGQNAVLAAAALGLEALPLGGFYDRRLDGLVGVDSLHESAVYAILLGGSR